MVGVEIDMVVTDSLKALQLYEKIFDIERVEVTDFPKGDMLDENPKFDLKAPNPDEPKGIWFNILVSDIKHKEVSFEERTRLWEDKKGNNN